MSPFYAVQRREAQDREIEALRQRLAAEFEAGAMRGSAEAGHRGDALASQLAEARQQCSEFAAEAQDLRAQAAALAGARDGAEAVLAAAQAELASVKSLLVRQEGGGGGGHSGGGSPRSVLEAAERLAQLEADNIELAQQLTALQAGLGVHAATAVGLDGDAEQLQQVRAAERA